MQNWKRKTDKARLIQFKLFIFYKAACLQKNFHGRLLSIRVFAFRPGEGGKDWGGHSTF